MTKNTAVDWLITQIRNQAQNGTLDALVITHLRKQAKAMEREQIVDAFGVGHNEGCSYMYDGKNQFDNKEQYYNETYGGDGA